MSSQLKPWLLLAVIFIVGVVTGSALTFGLGSHFLHRPGQQQIPGAQQINRLWMAQLVQRLELTSDQQAKIQPILTDAKTRIQSLHRDEMEHGSQIMKAAHDQISALLTPEQKVELQKMEAEREKMFLDHMRPWGSPHEGPGGMRHHGGPDDGMMPPPPPPAPGAPTNAAPSAP
jgi:Spy/CpxP family protein refolding chaperone